MTDNQILAWSAWLGVMYGIVWGSVALTVYQYHSVWMSYLGL